MGPFFFNALRFGLGSLVLIPLLLPRQSAAKTGIREANAAFARPLILGGMGAGSILFAGAALQQAGLVSTTAGKAAFITGLYVIIVPLMGLALGHKPTLTSGLGALIATAGLYLLSVTGSFSMVNGDLLEICGAFFWAAHLLVIGRLTARYQPLQLAFLQNLTCALLSLGMALFMEKIAWSEILAAAPAVVYSGFLSVGVAYTLQILAQKKSLPAHAAVILSLEAVFAAFGGWLLLQETLSARALFGCALMLAGMIFSSIFSSSRHSNNQVQ
jgi:drug/metabolite transporter (DMT)-like permease